MLRADVVVAQLQGLAQAQLEDALGARSEGDVALDRLLTLADDLNDGGADGLALDLHRLQGLGGDALALGDQAEQQVLRADVVVLETASLVLREHDDPASAVGKAFEHASPHFTGRALRRARRTPVPVDWLQPTKSSRAVRALSPWAQGGRGGGGKGAGCREGGAGAEAEGRTRGAGRAGRRGPNTMQPPSPSVHSPSISHAIRLPELSAFATNVAIPTTLFQCFKGVHGNCMQHLWGTITTPNRPVHKTRPAHPTPQCLGSPATTPATPRPQRRSARDIRS